MRSDIFIRVIMKPIQSKVQPLIWNCRSGVTPSLQILDQRLLPHEKKYLEIKTYKEVIQVIQNMALRGAPLIGIAASYGMVLAAQEFGVENLKSIAEEIKQSRPTAVNLKWAVDLILHDIKKINDTKKIIDAIIKRAVWIHEDDAKRCKKIGKHGASVIEQITSKRSVQTTRHPYAPTSILTICNTGALATGGIGTAFGVILTAYEDNENIKVFVTESRPRQQGARLTTFEFVENGISCTLISDAACGYLMQKGEIDLVITGADRIAANGDTANKIGTYQLAVLAKENKIPFYVAAPLSTFDLLCKSGKDIPIEERDPEEVTNINGKPICASGVKVRNPAFDITSGKYISGIITEKGVLKGNYIDEIKNIFNQTVIV